eukprot:6002503-Amphidinium_carterae.1
MNIGGAVHVQCNIKQVFCVCFFCFGSVEDSATGVGGGEGWHIDQQNDGRKAQPSLTEQWAH